MSTDIATRNATEVAVPKSILDLFAGRSNLVKREGVNSITYKGKVFEIHKDGVSKQLLDEDGNAVPAIEVIVLNANPRRSRTFYEGKFVDGESKAPDCSSYLGKVPASEVENPQSASCDTCPQSIKGSRTNEKGEPVTACQLRQRIVVIPSNDLSYDALLMNMASTSAYNRDNPDSAKGWHAWDQYKDELAKRGIPHTSAVKTKVRFAAGDAFPRLQFRFAGMLEEDEIIQLLPRIDSDEVMLLLNADHGKQQSEAKPIQIAKAETPKPVQAQEPEATPAPVAKPKPAAKPKAPEAKSVEPEDAPAPAAKAKPLVVEDDDATMAALTSWDD